MHVIALQAIHAGITHHVDKIVKDTAITIIVVVAVVSGAVFGLIGHSIGKIQGRRQR